MPKPNNRKKKPAIPGGKRWRFYAIDIAYFAFKLVIGLGLDRMSDLL